VQCAPPRHSFIHSFMQSQAHSTSTSTGTALAVRWVASRDHWLLYSAVCIDSTPAVAQHWPVPHSLALLARQQQHKQTQDTQTDRQVGGLAVPYQTTPVVSQSVSQCCCCCLDIDQFTPSQYSRPHHALPPRTDRDRSLAVDYHVTVWYQST